MVYTNMEWELRYYDEEGTLTHTLLSRRGVRQGYVLGIFIFCIAMAPNYLALGEKLGPEGMLVTYLDDCYLHGPKMKVVATIGAAPPLYKKVGLRIGWRPAKSELALPPNVDPETLQLPRGDNGRILSHLVEGLEACLGIPRHRKMCVDFITKAMKKPAARHNRLIILVIYIAEDVPLTTLRLL